MIRRNIKYLTFLLVFNNLFAQSNLENLSNAQLDALKKELQATETLAAENADNPLGPVVVIEQDIAEDQTIDSISEQFFGYDYFEREVNFFDNIPPSDQFKLGPGDEIILSLWGETNLRQNLTLNRDGSIFYDDIGFIKLDNKTIKEAESILSNQLSTIYSTINNKENSTELLLELGKLRSINVYFSGETKNPGINLIHPFSDIFTALTQAGVKTSGSLRNIALIRNGKTIHEFDFYSFFIDGKNTFSNVRILDGDVIHIPVVDNRVEIQGQAIRLGFFELIDSDKISDLIQYAGGLTPVASSKIIIRSVLPINKRISNDFARSSSLISLSQASSISLNNGDLINILEIGTVDTDVTIYGKVKFPGSYPSSYTLKSILDLAGGFNDPVYRKTIRDDEILVLRKDEENFYSKEIKISYDKSDNLALLEGDQIFVYENAIYSNLFKVTIEGQVNKRGTYQLKKDTTIRDIIDLAEGFTELANEEGITVTEIFTSLDEEGEQVEERTQVNDASLDFKLTNNSIINILPLENVISVKGNVYNPGLVVYSGKKSLKKYINLAGGPKPNTLKKRIYVKRANGRTKKVSLLGGVGITVKRGDTIFVPENPNPSDFDLAAFTADILSVLSNLAAILVIVDNSND